MTELRDGLAALAAEMRIIDVYEGVLRRSRRARRREHAVGALAAGAAIAGTVWAAQSYLPGPAPLNPAPDPSASPSASATPTPLPSPSSPSVHPTPTGSPSPGRSGEVDLRNATLEIVIPAGRGTGKVVDGVGTVDINVRYNLTIVSAASLEGGHSVAVVQIQADNGSPLRTVHIYRTAGGLPVDPTVLGNDNPGLFYDATKVVADGSGFVVTVNGAEWVYRQDPGTKEWRRTN